MKTSLSAVALATALGLAAASVAVAQAPPPAKEVAIDRLVLTLVPAKDGGKPLKVTSPAFKNMEDFPFENTQYRGDKFPGLDWSKGPKGTESYVVIMQDTDGRPNNDAVLHWTMYDVPADVTKLDAGLTSPPPGAMWGPNIRGKMQSYMGPRTPAGPKHRYHIQVFALDTVIPGDSQLSFDTLKADMTGHVLASGQVIGLGTVDPNAPPPPPRPAAH